MNIYDFDGTIYNGDSTVDFLLYSVRKHPSLVRFLPAIGVTFIQYALGRIQKTQAKEQLYRIFTGYDAPALLEEFWDKHQCKVFSWYRSIQAETDILISASPEFLLRPICQRLGIQYLIASRVDSRTGAYTGENCWGSEKVTRLRKDLGYTHCDTFYSDSYSDQPLADIADKAFLVRKNGRIDPWKSAK